MGLYLTSLYAFTQNTLYINKRTFIFTHDTMIQQYLLNCSWESSLNELLSKIMQYLKAGTEGLNPM